MNPHRGIRSMVLAAWGAGIVMTAWAAPPGVTEKMGTTRSGLVPAPLPQAVPAGQGVRAPGSARPSVALPSEPELPVASPVAGVPAVATAARPTLPSTDLTRSRVESAPVAPSLAAHGMPLGVAMAPPAAGTDAAPVATAASTQPAKAVDKPKRHGVSKGSARAPADSEPRLRSEPVVPHMAAAAQKHTVAAGRPAADKPRRNVKAAAASKAVTPKTVKPASTHPANAKKRAAAAGQRHRLNDGSHP